jgi:hypothetical protein
LRQAHARLEQYEDERIGREATYPPLRAVTRRGGGSVEAPDRRPLADLDEDLLDTRPPGRGAPRRPTGAAVDYARASTGDAPRRTVRINGHGAQAALRPTPSELRGPRPDRIAAWAVAFAIFLALLAALVGG